LMMTERQPTFLVDRESTALPRRAATHLLSSASRTAARDAWHGKLLALTSPKPRASPSGIKKGDKGLSVAGVESCSKRGR
jgi:hypothetical protein